MPHRDVRLVWARFVAVAVTSVSSLYLCAVFAFGVFLFTTDLSAISCFDRDDAACTGAAEGAAGLGAVQASSWVLGSVAVLSVLGASVLSIRLRRASTGVAVVALAATSVVISQVLYARL